MARSVIADPNNLKHGISTGSSQLKLDSSESKDEYLYFGICSVEIRRIRKPSSLR
jgi:hypothetical protein